MSNNNNSQHEDSNNNGIILDSPIPINSNDNNNDQSNLLVDLSSPTLNSSINNNNNNHNNHHHHEISINNSRDGIHLRKSTVSTHGDPIIEYEQTLNRANQASIYIAKALEIVDGRSKEENSEWSKANSEYYHKLVERYQRDSDTNVHELKSRLYATWSQEVEERYSLSSPETHDVITNLRLAHQTLFDDIEIQISSPNSINQSNNNVRKSQTLLGRDGFLSVQNDLFGIGGGNNGSGVNGGNGSGIPKPLKERMTKFVKRTFTIVDWVSNYKMEYLQNDISVGLSSGTMIIPQSMAYAFLAGLPPIYGLYCAFIPPLIYGLFGSSRHLATGPLALMSIMVGAAVQSLNPATMEEYVGLANLLSLLVGVNFLIMCFLQLGFLINFLSRPVLSGFTSAAAIIIIMSQANFLFGIGGSNQKYAWKYAIHIISNLGDTNWLAVVMSVCCFALLYIFKNYLKTIPRTTIPVPAPLILVTLGLVLSFVLDLESKGIAVVGSIPSGLPSPSFFTNFDLDSALSLYKDSLVIPIVGLIETVSAAKVAANKCRYELSMNKELFAMGMANIIGCIFQSYPVAGAFGRTSLHLSSGAKTQLTTYISVFVVGITLLFLTKVFYYLPKVVLAAIVIFAVSQLVDLEEVQKLFKINKIDMFLLLVAFWATIVLGVQPGIATAVVLSLILVIYQSSKPNTSVCGRVPGTATYQDVILYPEAITEPGVIVFRFDSPIIFVNAYYLRKQLKKIYRLEDETKNPLIKSIVLDCSSITNIDSTGVKYLKELIRELTELSIVIAFGDVRPNVLDSLKVSKIYQDLGADHFFLRVHEAVKNSPSLTIRPHVEEIPGLKLNCLSNPGDTYKELY